MAEIMNPNTTTSTGIFRGELADSLDTQAPVVWAIDAFPDEHDVNLRTTIALRELFSNAPIHPVYVLSEESFLERGYSTFLKPALKPMALKALNQILEESHEVEDHLLEAQHLHFQKPRVLIETSASRPLCARKLMRYAERIGARMIVLGSHGRTGISRFLVGSFSEAVVNHSHLPMIIAGPNLEWVTSPPHVVVYPTDFTPMCRAALPQILDLALQYDAEIHFFHKENHIVDPLVQSGVNLLGGGWVTMEPYMEPSVDNKAEEAEDWIRRAQAVGLRARFVGENYREPTSEAIVEYVRGIMSASPILAMVSQTGPIASRLLGSVTRDVIRASPCPVYVAAHED